MIAGKVCGYCGSTYTKPHNMANSKFCDSKCAKANERAKGPARFWAKVDKGPHPKGCWLYTGFIKWDGYGWVARTKGNNRIRYMTAHRYAWILTHGEPKKGLHILHHCDVAACCNPAHLWLGTHADNMADMKAKGRTSKGFRSRGHAVLHPDRVRPVKQPL